MQYAIVNHERVQAFPKGKGICELCGSLTIARCGPRKIHHWAHFRERNCDPWWENETLWHREWKNLFPENCREISHVAPNGEIHRADIKTPNGIVVEVQHSNITDDEKQSREAFYKNLIWIVDGKSFRKNFDFYHMLPDPKSELALDIVWAKAKRSLNGANRGLFFRLSENPGEDKLSLSGGRVHSISEIEEEIKNVYKGHHQYDWIKARKIWLDSHCPVFIDFGEEYVVRLMTYDESNLKCLQLVSKRKLVSDLMKETQATTIAI